MNRLVIGLLIIISSLVIGYWSFPAGADTWTLFYDSASEAYIDSLAVYNGELYAGTRSSGLILKYNGSSWSTSYNSPEEAVRWLEVYNNELYASTQKSAKVYEFDGSSWSLAQDFSSTHTYVYVMEVHNNKLYVGLSDDTGGDAARLYSFDGSSWTDLGVVDSGEYRILALQSFDGYLWIGTGYNAKIYKYDGSSFSLSYDVGGGEEYLRSFAVYNSKLYAGSARGKGYVYRYDGDTTWTRVLSIEDDFYGGSYSGYLYVFCLEVANNKLYAGRGGSSGDSTANDILSYDGSSWSNAGNLGATYVNDFEIYNNALYAGIYPEGRIYSTEATDTQVPLISSPPYLLTSPEAGNTSISIKAVWTENNPGTNYTGYDLNNSGYSSWQASGTNTTTSVATFTVSALDGNDYIYRYKVMHVDDSGNTATSEVTTPAYVKPYTPPAPAVSNPTSSTVDVKPNKHSSEVEGLKYAIYETSQGKYVQADGTLGNSAVWQTLIQWGTITATGLSSQGSNYYFKTKSRNSSDDSTESDWSASASAANTTPTINITSVSQRIDGSKHIEIHFTGTDANSDSCTLVSTQYAKDPYTSWSNLTFDTADSSHTAASSMAFSSSGTNYIAVVDVSSWSSGNYKIKLQANDGKANSEENISSAFEVDASVPTITLSHPVNNAIIGTSTPTFSWTSEATDIKYYELVINQGTYTATTSATSYSWPTTLSDGSYSWKVRAIDHYGNIGDFSTVYTFVIDTYVPPQSGVTIGEDGTTLKDGDVISSTLILTIKISGEVEIDSSTIQIKIDGTAVTDGDQGSYDSWEPTSNTIRYKLKTPLSVGTHTISVSAKDTTGNTVVNYEISGLKVMGGSSQVYGTALNAPNPFNPDQEVTYIVYTLTTSGETGIYIYDLNSNLVWQARYTAGSQGGNAGVNKITWDGSTTFGDKASNGIYLYKIVNLAEKKITGKGKIIVLR